MGIVRIAWVASLLFSLAACGGALGPDIPEFDIPDVESGPAVRIDPTIALASNGKATCVWVGDDHIYAERFLPGYGWTDFERIDDDPAPASTPQVTTSPVGDTVLVWEQDGEVVANCFEVGSGWLGVEPVSAPGGAPATTPALGTADDGTTVVVWEEGGEVHSRCLDPLTGWQPPIVVAAPLAPAHTVDVAVSPGGDAVAVWNEGLDEVVASTFDAATNTWSPPQSIGTGTAPVVSVDGGDGAIVVVEQAGEVVAAVHDPVDGWQPPVLLPVPAAVEDEPASAPAVGMGVGGDAMVVFQVDGETYASRHEPGLGFEEARAIAPGLPTMGHPQVALDGEGNAIAVMEAASGRVQTTIYRQAYDDWRPPEDVGAGRQPAVDANGSGEAITVFVTGDSVSAARIRDLDPSMPRSVSVVIDGQGHVGADLVAFDCYPGAAPEACAVVVPDGASFTVTATPMAGHTFSHWEGLGAINPLPVSVSGGDVTLTAVFVAVP